MGRAGWGACSAAKASGITIRFGAIVSNELEALRTGDGRQLPPMLKAEIRRELDRIGGGDDTTGCGRTRSRRAGPARLRRDRQTIGSS